MAISGDGQKEGIKRANIQSRGKTADEVTHVRRRTDGRTDGRPSLHLALRRGGTNTVTASLINLPELSAFNPVSVVLATNVTS